MVRLLLIRDTTDADGEFVLAEDIVIRLGVDLAITVPAGTKTDFASIPAAARWLIRREGTDVAGLVHDHLYRSGRVRRQIADGILYALCRDAGVSPTRCLILFAAVAITGGRHYRPRD